ncbi:hypothetical protein MMC30_008149 [Trapelia coarctata]|nr:hypothetical protein [Trapelia coarctata]
MPAQGSIEERFPELFNQTTVDPWTRKRDRKMKVLVIGMMRTGTKSMKAALEELGIREVYHMTTTMKNPKDADMWTAAINAKFFNKGKKFTRKEWDSLLGNCEACIDVPTAAFMPELIEAYPEAKVIVSERDPEKWYTSLSTTVGARATNWRIITLSLLDPFFLGKWGPFTGSLMQAVFGSKGVADKENALRTYKRMHQEVRDIAPKEKLLEYKLGDGWEPLCKFLNKDVPDEPFPFINESHEFQQRVDLIEKQSAIRAAKNILPIVGAAALVSAWYFGYLHRFS